jgi:hypothetical protein
MRARSASTPDARATYKFTFAFGKGFTKIARAVAHSRVAIPVFFESDVGITGREIPKL